MPPRCRAAAAVVFFFFFFFDVERFTATDNTYKVRGFLVTYFLFLIFYNIIVTLQFVCAGKSHTFSMVKYSLCREDRSEISWISGPRGAPGNTVSLLI